MMQPVSKKLVAVDLDGTLLDYQNRLSQRNIDAVRSVVALGVAVVPVSARPPFGIEHALREMNLYRYLIAYNGSLVLDRATGQMLVDRTIAPEDAEAVVRLVEKHGLYAGYYLGNRFYVSLNNACAEKEARFLGRSPLVVPSLLPLAEQGASKIIIIELDSPERLSAFYEEGTRSLKGVNLSPSTGTTIEISHQDTSKGAGLDILAGHLGIDPLEIVAIGDNYNDLSMLEYAGMSVVVDNAPASIKPCVDLVVAACDRDGVAEALERIFPVQRTGREQVRPIKAKPS